MDNQPGIYGTEQETFYVNNRGETYLIQSPDLTGQFERVGQLPDDADPLPESVTGDIEIPDEIR